MFFLVIRNSSNKRRIGGAALINCFVPDAALIRVNTVISLVFSEVAKINFCPRRYATWAISVTSENESC